MAEEGFRKEIELPKKGWKVVVKESSEETPEGFIIDVWFEDNLIDTETYWYNN